MYTNTFLQTTLGVVNVGGGGPCRGGWVIIMVMLVGSPTLALESAMGKYRGRQIDNNLMDGLPPEVVDVSKKKQKRTSETDSFPLLGLGFVSQIWSLGLLSPRRRGFYLEVDAVCLGRNKKCKRKEEGYISKRQLH